MKITRSGTAQSADGPSAYFTGAVHIAPLLNAPDPSRLRAALVTFEAGARTAWHTHPLGQTLIITSGSGYAQSEAGPVQALHPGDVVWFPPDERHWHGATAEEAMSHIALQEALDGETVAWHELVSDAQYTQEPSRTEK
ncbi:cupin domain-containing protein [Roseobacter fucihabitans]|nr:cupin domain-containing protein [Roseobacter litoralis]